MLMDQEEARKKIFTLINSEFKAFILGYLVNKTYKSTNELIDTATFVCQSCPLTYKKSYRTKLDSRIQRNLSEFVDEQIEPEENNRISWKLKEEEIRKGIIPITRYFIKVGSELDISWREFLGQNYSNTAQNSLILLETIVNGADRKIDVQKNLNLHAKSIKKRLEKFKELGIIEYNSIEQNHRGQKIYELSDNLTSIETRSENKGKIYSLLKNGNAQGKHSYSVEEIMKKTKIKYRLLIKLLGELEKENYVSSKKGFIQKGRSSRITLTKKGKQLYDKINLMSDAYLRSAESLNYIKNNQPNENDLEKVLNNYPITNQLDNSNT